MYKCRECGNEFDYKDILKANTWIKRDIICRKCNKYYSVSIITNVIGIIPIGLIPFINTWINGNWITFLLIGISYIVLIMLLSPFFTKLVRE